MTSLSLTIYYLYDGSAITEPDERLFIYSKNTVNVVLEDNEKKKLMF